MLYFDSVVVSVGTDTSKTNASKEFKDCYY